MCKAKHRPDNDVFVLDIVASCHGIGNATDLLRRLQREATASVKLVIFILGDPEMMLCERRTFVLYAFGIRQQQLGRRRCKLVTHRVTADAILP